MSNEDLIKQQLFLYTEQFTQWGDSPQGTFNQHSHIQNLRFERLLKQLSFQKEESLHDIGCGICDLYSYLESQSFYCQYSGTDIVPEMLDLARAKYPNTPLFCRDILSSSPSEEYDYVVLAGTFNLPGSTPRPQWQKFIRHMIKKMFSMATQAVVFNCLSTHAEYYNPDMHYEDPNEITQFCINELSRFVVLDHAYPLYEFTITIYKDSVISNTFQASTFDKYLKRN
jgi:cyclopropane fatty-acyl-phospholipid synthase-like methyltransferase